MQNTENIQPIGVRDFMTKFKSDENMFNVIPEFSFIKPVAQKAKNQGCECGLGQEINRTIMIFNDFIENLEPQLVFKVGQYFNLPKICFQVQTQDNFSIKCYS